MARNTSIIIRKVVIPLVVSASPIFSPEIYRGAVPYKNIAVAISILFMKVLFKIKHAKKVKIKGACHIT